MPDIDNDEREDTSQADARVTSGSGHRTPPQSDQGQEAGDMHGHLDDAAHDNLQDADRRPSQGQ